MHHGGKCRWIIVLLRLHTHNIFRAALKLLLLLASSVGLYAITYTVAEPHTVHLLHLIHNHAEFTGPVIVAESNTHFHLFVKWWQDNVKKLQPPLQAYFFVALNPQEYRALKQEVPMVAYNRGTNLAWWFHNMEFRTMAYNAVVLHRWRTVVEVLRIQRDVLLTDLDVLWRRNPVEYIRTLPVCDFYAATDAVPLPEEKGAPRLYPPFPHQGAVNWLNLGFFYIRSNPRTIALARSMMETPDLEEDDQALFNGKLEAMRKAAGDAAVVSHNATTCASYGNFTFHVLPPNLFMNKRHFELYPQFRDPILIHFNYMLTLSEKVEYLKQHGFW
eukprot:EG_transcript_19023